jgi:hypothetical protein
MSRAGALTALLVGLLLAVGGGIRSDAAAAAANATCTSAEKSQYEAAAARYAKQLPKDRARYFKTHRSPKLRTAFVKKQKAKLRALRARAACDDTPIPPPIDRNPAPSPNETFSFGPGMSAASQELIKGDIAFAGEDEARLVGLSIAKVTVFASTDPNWLAAQQCAFYGYGGDCVSGTAAFYRSGNSAAQGGPGAVFLYWAASSWQAPAGDVQKIIAHELFHALQYQTDHLNDAGSTPFDQVRPTGPVWLDEGVPEMIAYRVADDRLLLSYPGVLNNQIAIAKRIAAPLNQLERLSQTGIPSVYSLFALAVDHLTKTAPAGLGSIAAYYRALGAGAAWPDAFKQAFGLNVAEYYANFAEYRAKL